MKRDDAKIYIKFDYGEDIVKVLHRVADNIVNGKVHCTGIERDVDEDRNYWVKDCGDYELLVNMPVRRSENLEYDVDGLMAICFDVRNKKSQKK